MTQSTTEPSSTGASAISERGVIALVGAVQFVNVLDFMMVMPLGPDFGRELGIPMSSIGVVAGSYTAAAALAGILGSFFLDSLGTVAGGFSIGFRTLLASRVLAGAFGGPATAVGIAIIADVVPPARRGQAMGKVMGAFAVASVFGVPIGLESARLFGFRAPFFGVAALTLLAAGVALRVLPALRDHLSAERRKASADASIVEPTILLSLTTSAIIMLGNFSLIPNLSAYLQYNLHFPREKLGLVYAVGGAATFFAMRITGRLVDRLGAATMILVGSIAFGSVLVGIFLVPVLVAMPIVAFALFMTSNSLRFVPVQSLGSRVPTQDRRARFLSAQSAVQHMGSSLGAMGASAFLSSAADGRLVGLERIAVLVLGLAALVPFFGFAIERRVRAREADEASAAAQP